MEDEQFDLLPDPSYVRGFLRAYAGFLGLDPGLAVDEYDSRFGTFGGALGPEDARRSRRREQRRPRRREAQVLWLAIGGVMGIALLAWLGLGQQTVPSPSPVPGVPTTTTTAGTVPSPSVDLVFTGRGERGTYLEVRVGSDKGTTVYSGVLVPEATRTFTVKESAWVRIGSPRAVAVSVNGARLEISGGTGTFLITRAGAARLPAG